MSGDCKYKPCHDMKNLDCRLCYCPFYEYCPTLGNIQREGANVSGYLLDRSELGLPPVWACELCELPHYKEVVDFYEENKDKLSIKELFDGCHLRYNEALYRTKTDHRVIVRVNGGWYVARKFMSKGMAALFLRKLKARHPEGYIDSVPSNY